MIPQYSANAYIIKLLTQTKRAILVEGQSDRDLVLYIMENLREKTSLPIDDVLVDTAEMLINPSIPLSNREKVEQIHALANNQKDKFAAFVGREYRSFGLAEKIDDQIAKHQVVDGNLFWTRGHSIENYVFSEDCVCDWLSLATISMLPSNFKAIVKQHFKNILFQATALSLSAYQLHIVGRLKNILTAQDWVDNLMGDIEISQNALLERLINRSINEDTANELIVKMNYYLDITNYSKYETVRWVAHGHLAWEVIWSGISKLFGTDRTIAKNICWGDQRQKRAACFRAWAYKSIGETEEYPTDFINWILNPQ